jgi:Tfp pilus assembly protein PilX
MEAVMIALRRPWTDDRGVALPMALLALTLLTTLMIAFVVLSQSEPVIANNQLRVAQARDVADAGFERAVWALNQGLSDTSPPANARYIDKNLAGAAPAPYNGGFVTVGNGEFALTVVALNADERQITATGWVPNHTTSATKAHRTIQATVLHLPDFSRNTFCALCVRGDVQVWGSSLVDGTTDPGCRTVNGVAASGRIDQGGSAQVVGGSQPNTPTANFDQLTYGPKELLQLRELAKANGTYFGPGYPNGTSDSNTTYDGNLTFDSSHKLKNGVIFIDTVSGHDIPTDTTAQNAADFAHVDIHGNPFCGTDSTCSGGGDTFRGWIIVNGSLSISGNMTIDGLVYAVNDLTYNGTGTGQILGLAVSQNVRDTTMTSISSNDDDSSTTGNSRIRFNCANAASPGGPPIGFLLEPGSYRECSDAGCP